MVRVLLLVLLFFYSVALAYKARLEYIQSKLKEERYNTQLAKYEKMKYKLSESTKLLNKSNETAWDIHNRLN